MSLAGRMLYRLWHRPRAWCAQVRREGGYRAHRAIAKGRHEMERAAHRLPPPPLAPGSPLELHLLTGASFWYQSAFCLHRFALHAARPLAPIIYDDGTLRPDHIDVLRRLFPSARFVSRAEQLSALDRHLPADRFPALRERWANYPHIRKIIAPHLGSHGWKLVIDSDLLFFRRPDFLIAWLDHPDRPLHAVDCVESYGYPRRTMTELAGRTIPPLVNVGLAGLRSEDVDWQRLEKWTADLINRHGTSYLLEQALFAMLASDRPCAIAPATDYVTNPVLPEASRCRAVMHHYVAESKRWYFLHNWRRSNNASPDNER